MNEQHTGTRKRSKSHKLIVTISVAAAVTLAFCALTWAVDDDGEHRAYGRHGGMGAMAMDGGPMMGGGRMGHFMIRALDRHLDLSDEQRAAIEQIVDDSRAEGRALRTQIQPLFEQIRASIEQDGFDEDGVRILLENQSPQMIDMMLLRIRTLADIRAQLTPEQQAAAKELFESRRGRFMR